MVSTTVDANAPDPSPMIRTNAKLYPDPPFVTSIDVITPVSTVAVASAPTPSPIINIFTLDVYPVPPASQMISLIVPLWSNRVDVP